MLKLLNFSCSRCLFPSDHSDHFLVNINRWCHAHSGDARTAREKLAAMPTDADIDFLFSVYSASPSREDGGPEWGDRAVWEDLHHRDPYPFWLD